MFSQVLNNITGYIGSFFASNQLNGNQTSRQVSKMLLQAIAEENFTLLNELLFTNPQLVNSNLSDGRIPINVAVSSNKEKVVELFLLYGANIFRTDDKNLNAIDYASFINNEHLLCFFNAEKNKIEDCCYLIQSLLVKTTQLLNVDSENLQAEDNGVLRISILISISDYLSSIDKDSSNAAKLLDLYLVANTIFNIVFNYSAEALKEEVLKFLTSREDLLKGDSHDYCFCNSLANYLCYDIVKIIKPDENPLNLIFKNLITQDRDNPWKNPYTLESDMPAPYEFFRNENNQLQLYEGILERAIAELKSGETNLDKIWLGTDNKKADNDVLNDFDMEIVHKRSPTFKRLLTYTKRLKRDESSLFARFKKLEEAISDGMHRMGEAPEYSHKAVAEFCEWWYDLPKIIQNKIKVLDYRLHILIETITTSRDYCVAWFRGELGAILSVERVRLELNAIDNTIERRVTDDKLNEWKEKILQELAISCPISTNKNIFRKICNDDYLFNLFFNCDFLDYKSLSINLELLSNSTIINSDVVLNNKELQSFILKFIENLVTGINQPDVLVKCINKIFEIELQNPLIINRNGYHDIVKGYRWKHTPVSYEWAALVDKVKEKILKICNIDKTIFEKDDREIVEFLATPTARFSSKFYTYTSSIKLYKNLKENYLGETLNNFNRI